MNRLWKPLLVVAALSFPATQADAKTSITVLYPYPSLFKGLHEEIAKTFMAERPDIEIKFLAPAADYEDATQQVLRGAVAGKMPDVAYQGLNRVRIFVERKLAIPFAPLIKSEKNWNSLGYGETMIALGKVGDAVYGIPFSISTPVLYINDDLVKKVGGNPDKFPKTWPDIMGIGKKISGLGGGITGVHIEYTITGNWMFQALVFSHGGSFLTADEKKPAIDSAAGVTALEVLKAATEAGMQDQSSSQARAAFVAGKIGVYADSTAFLGTVTRQVKDQFKFRTAEFPVPAKDGKLPAGGNVAMIFAKDKAKQKAAWEYIKFATGPVGQTLMVQKTGYMPINDISIKDPKYLGKFYQTNPNHMTSIRQLPVMTSWYAFPGANALKITDVIKDDLQTVVAKSESPAAVAKNMAKHIGSLLPK